MRLGPAMEPRSVVISVTCRYSYRSQDQRYAPTTELRQQLEDIYGRLQRDKENENCEKNKSPHDLHSYHHSSVLENQLRYQSQNAEKISMNLILLTILTRRYSSQLLYNLEPKTATKYSVHYERFTLSKLAVIVPISGVISVCYLPSVRQLSWENLYRKS